MNFQLPAILSFKLTTCKTSDCNGISFRTQDNVICTYEHVWRDVSSVIDFYDSTIKCELNVAFSDYWALFFLRNKIEVISLLVKYNGISYDTDATKIEIFVSDFHDTTACFGNIPESKKIKVSFSLQETVIHLVPKEQDKRNCLVFSGASSNTFRTSVEYKGQTFNFESPQDNDLLTVSSESKFPPDCWRLIILAFSLFQNARITLLESHSTDEFQLYIQLPPSAGTRFCKDTNIFILIWKWLSQNDNFLSQNNILDFFLAGAMNHGSDLDFRLINLFICMDAISGKENITFGEKVSKTFHLSIGDGYWMAYVRNNMIHEGKCISEAIVEAFEEFENKQNQKNGMEIIRYKVYSQALKKDILPFALYCDVIDLIMKYFMEKIDYHEYINSMTEIYGVVVE